MLNRYFKLDTHFTDVRPDLVAGLFTFVTMAYIIFVNPTILGDAGMPKTAVLVSVAKLNVRWLSIMPALMGAGETSAGPAVRDDK